MATELSFTGSTVVDSAGNPVAVTYTALIDTVNPPVKAYPVPASIVPDGNGTLTVTFTELGFGPIPGVTYFVDVTATDVTGTSTPSAVVSFSNAITVPVPPAPTNPKVG